MSRGGLVFALGIAALIHAAPIAAAAEEPAAGLAFERGARALRSGDVDGALEALSRAASLDPDNATTLGLYARALVIAGRGEDAYGVLERLRAIAPDAAELVYLRGLARYREGDWSGARDDLQAALATEPDHPVLHLLLGRVHQELGDLDAAERELGEALRLDPTLEPHVSYRLGLIAVEQRRIEDATARFEEVAERLSGSALAGSASRHLAHLNQTRLRKWELWATVGGGYDSNVNLANDDDVLAVSDKSDVLAITSVGASYQPLHTERFSLRVGQQGSADFHAEESDFDLQISETWAVARLRLARWAEADFRYSFEYVWADWDAFRRTHMFEPAIQLAPARDVLIRAFYRYQDRDYYDIDLEEEFDRDGHVGTAGLDIYFKLPELLPSVTCWLRAGYRFREEHTAGNQYDADGHEPILTVSLTLPQNLVLTLDGRYEWRQYDERSLVEPGEGRRSDRIGRFDLGISRAFGRHLDLGLRYGYTKRSSDVDPFDYQRNELQMLATVQF